MKISRLSLLIMVNLGVAVASIPPYYGTGLCQVDGFHCIQISAGQTWSSLFPIEKHRLIVQKINRTYNVLVPGKTLAVPDDLNITEILDFAPFEQQLTISEKQIIVDQNKLAWGAYDAHGKLLNWGPISSGTDFCSDNHAKSCLTITGTFRFFNKEDKRCTSGVYPLERGGGAKMFWCMFFHKGFALHGSTDIPGRRASHGCVRLFTADAQWLNEHFVEIASDKNHQTGTLVIVKPLRRE